MLVTIINADVNGKKYTVERVFSMVANYHFTSEGGTTYLVDAEDVQEWADDQGIQFDGLKTAIAYANYYATEQEDGVFWWAIKG